MDAIIKIYVNPEMEITEFDEEDIITASVTPNDDGDFTFPDIQL